MKPYRILWFIFFGSCKNKKATKRWHKDLFIKLFFKNYIMSSAFANHVHTKGSTKMQTPPIYLYNTKKAATDKRKSIQYKPVDLFASSILKIFTKIVQNDQSAKAENKLLKFRTF